MFTVLTTVLSIKELGLVNMKGKNSWLKMIIIELISTGLVVVLSNFNKIFSSISMLFLIVPLILILKIEKNSILRIISSIIIVIVIMFIIDMLIYPMGLYFEELLGIAENSVVIRTIADMIILILSYFINKFINKATKKIKGLIKEYSVKVSPSAMIILVILFITIISLMKYTFNMYSVNNELMLFSILVGFTYLALLTLVVFLVYKGLNRTLVNRQKKREIKDIIEYASRLEDVSGDMRKFKNDYINILNGMLGYIDNNDIKGLQKALKEKVISMSSELDRSNSNIELLYKIKIKEIKAIMISKVLKAQEIGIDVSIDMNEEINNISMETIDYCKCLSLILDNAIYGSRHSEKGSIKIGFVNSEKVIALIVSNSVKEDSAPVYKLYEKGFPESNDRNGTSLSELRDITIKYPNVYLDTKIEGGVLSQILEVE
jgi:two-component system sensor histidine kinase AgrC